MPTPKKIHESRVQREMNTCQHFNGILNDVCRAGVRYWDLVPDGLGCALKLPCLMADQRPDAAACDKRHLPTREEAEREVEASERACRDVMVAMDAAHNHAHAAGLGEANGGNGKLPCPVCKVGEIHYSVASYNGHMHARCSTPECVKWME